MAKKAASKPQVPEAELTAQDAHNILMLLNRAETKGIQEAQVLLHVCGKLDAIRGNFEVQEEDNGEDVSSID
ncbi:hypothetical protein CMI47_04460 [Candidatus Pacearchaeota archaeon]|jgi:hypothetical protein|nr:hypothetical protein [Candidatus Pacearchaeota archaeon]|tara:strand:+ start:6576 stop:6791 length:216 start_codon:yes stop_codon:yes gene_type:complete